MSTNDRFTPGYVLEVVKTFAPIGLDPCTTSDNPALAYEFFTEQQSGLSQDWRAALARAHEAADFSDLIAYVNPPYGRGHLIAWANAMTHWGREGCEIIGLVPADMSTVWMRVLLGSATAIAFWHKRISFGTPEGGYEAGAKFGNAFVYYGERQGRFKRVFSPHAHVLVLR